MMNETTIETKLETPTETALSTFEISMIKPKGIQSPEPLPPPTPLRPFPHPLRRIQN